MALVLANRVQETGTANTTVSFTLTGAVTGFQSFAVIGNTNTTYYSATDGSGNWEVGLGTYSTTGPTLTRTTVYASSNSGSAVTFSGAVNVFVTYPSGRSVNLNESGNVSALGTVSSGTWQGSTVGVAYGGTGVTTSSGPNSVVLRDANENITVNRISQGLQTITASGGVTTLTAASDFNQQLVGTGGHTFRLPDATTLTDTTTFQFNNNATGTLTIENNAATTVGTVAPGGAAGIALMNNATSGGTWDVHSYIPENVSWGTNALYLNSTVITGGTWNGGTITPAYGGTGLTSFTTNGAVYATGTTTLTSGTLPVISGGTGTVSVPTNGQLLIGNGSTYTVASLGTGTGISTTVGSGTLTINNTGVTSLAGTSPVTASASTGSVTMSLASGYGDTQNPYASKTANFFLAAPNGSAGAPTFRAVVAADIPTLNQNTTGSAGSVTNAVTFNNGGTGDASGTTFNGSAARTISYNTVGAPSTGGANATGTWGISITGNAATATTASNVNNGTLSMGVSGTGLSGSASFTANQSGNSTFTVTSNATNANTGSTIVARDASGNFSAGTITATLSGSATSAGSVSNSVTFNNGGAGGASGSTFNGSGALTVSYNTVGAPSTTGTNASGTWGINVTGNAATATTATNQSGGTVNATTGAFSGSLTGTAALFSGQGRFSGWYSSGSGLAVEVGISGTEGYVISYNRTSSAYADLQLNGTNIKLVPQGGSLTGPSGNVILHAGNYNSYAPTLTGGGASGTWGISISGSAAQLGGYGSTTYVGKFGNTYYQTDTWIQCNAIGGLYWPATNAAELNANSTSTYGAIAIIGARNGWRGIHFQGGGNTPHLMFDGSANGGIYYETGGRWASYYNYSNNCWGIGTSTTNATYNVYADKGYYAGTRIDSPIFYDANNTGYYVDPASTSNVNQINMQGYLRRNTSAAGYMEGNYPTSVDGNSSACIYTIGGSYQPTSTTLGNMYGVGYTIGNGTANPGLGMGGWGFYVAGGGVSRVFLDADSGTVISSGSVRSQIFYDSNNTGYYLDPTSTTSLRTVGDWRSDSSTWTGEFAGKIQYHSSNWYFQYNSNAIFRNSGGSNVVTIDSSGNLSANGNVTASSDERLKTNWRDLPADFVEQLSNVKAGVYDRVDEEGMTQVGVSAQSLQTLMPNAVTQNADGMLGVAYGNAALVSAIKLAERVLQIEQRIKQLERIA